MSLRRALCAMFRPKRNVRRKKKWPRLYLEEYFREMNGAHPMPNRERR